MRRSLARPVSDRCAISPRGTEIGAWRLSRCPRGTERTRLGTSKDPTHPREFDAFKGKLFRVGDDILILIIVALLDASIFGPLMSQVLSVFFQPTWWWEVMSSDFGSSRPMDGVRIETRRFAV